MIKSLHRNASADHYVLRCTCESQDYWQAIRVFDWAQQLRFRCLVCEEFYFDQTVIDAMVVLDNWPMTVMNFWDKVNPNKEQ